MTPPFAPHADAAAPAEDRSADEPPPTPTESGLPLRRAAFRTLAEAVDYAAGAATGCNVYSGRGALVERLSYGDIRRRARSLARRLLRSGVARGDRVGLFAEATGDFVVGFMACQYAAAVPVPLPGPLAFGDWQVYRGRLARQLAHCGARLAVGPLALVQRVRSEPDDPVPIPHLSWCELAALPAGIDLPEPLAPDELCYIQYSSGTTRVPRGVANTQRALLENCRAIAEHGVGIGPDDRGTSWLPLHHDMGLVGALLTALTCQRSLDLMASEDFARRPIQWLRLISRNGGTVSYSPCFGYELCVRRLRAADAGELDLRRWRVAGIGGEMIRAAAIQDFCTTFAPMGFRASAVVASYGLAEATLGVTFARPGAGLAVDWVARGDLGAGGWAIPAGPAEGRGFAVCGRPLPGCSVSIRDADGRSLPERRVGTIFVRGPSVMQGYLGDAAATARAITPDGWLDTGDLGYLVGGELVVVGRAKDTIIVNGRNIAPQDLEWAVGQLPGLRAEDCAAFAVTGPDGREEAVILIQRRQRDGAQGAELVAAAQREIRRGFGIECRPVLVPPKSLPRTSSGKLSRSAARDNLIAGVYGTDPP
jgi:fatty-acyl-CoA synthase